MKRPPMTALGRAAKVLLVASIWAPCAAPPRAEAAAPCRRCGWAPPKARATVAVRTMAELRAAVDRARPGTTILLDDGVYRLDRMLELAVPDLVLRGRGGDRAKVQLRGRDMAEREVGVAVAIGAPRVTLADLTVGAVGLHGVQVRGEAGASDAVLHNVRVVDAGQQLLKGSVGPDGRGADRGLVACSAFEYMDHAPSDYTNGVDVLGGRGWVVRDSLFRNIHGPREKGRGAGPAILFWVRSEGTVVERNVVADCFRGIALGLVRPRDDGPRFDHRGGVVRHNVVCNPNAWADEGIEVNACPDARVEHNTVLVEGGLPWSISVRFPETTGLVRNNLTNRAIATRDGARMEQRGNVAEARRDWFADPGHCLLRLARGDVAAIDAGVAIPGVRLDFDLRPRVAGKAPDAGAFEYAGAAGPGGRPGRAAP